MDLVVRLVSNLMLVAIGKSRVQSLMNATTVDDLADTITKTSKAKGPAPRARSRFSQTMEEVAVSPWKWLAITCSILAISGAARYWRDMEVTVHAEQYKKSPFPLSEIPKALGDWTFIEGSEDKLDPEIARIAGSSDHIIRKYVQMKSGETVSVLILYGLAASVFAHSC